MRDLATLFVHLVWTIFRLLGPGGVRSVVAGSMLLRHQLLILNRSRERAPNLRPTDRLIAGLCTLLIRPTRLLRTAVVLKPSTLMGFHRALVKRKYRRLVTPRRRGTPGPNGPPPELIDAVLEMKRRNPRFGYQRIAEQLALASAITEFRPRPPPVPHPSLAGESQDPATPGDQNRALRAAVAPIRRAPHRNPPT